MYVSHTYSTYVQPLQKKLRLHIPQSPRLTYLALLLAKNFQFDIAYYLNNTCCPGYAS